jgi:hypothetical protein
MINRIDFAVRTTIQNSFDLLLKNSLKDFILFLADGEYIDSFKNLTTKLSPYVIDYRIDKYRDESRLLFLTKFLTEHYNFPTSQIQNDDDEYRMQMELMIYCHTWESKPFLKKIYRLAHLVNGEKYEWDVKVPNMSKHEFIRFNIKEILKSNNNNISEIIKKGYHSSLRNAFAHSEFSFDKINNHNRINLYNYSGNNWELQTISFDDWTKRFVYSVLFSFHLLKLTYNYRNLIIEKTGKSIFEIEHPNSLGELNIVKIEYKKEQDSFIFVR